jgi:hypothetical protein
MNVESPVWASVFPKSLPLSSGLRAAFAAQAVPPEFEKLLRKLEQMGRPAT